MEEAALAALDPDALIRDAARLVQKPSVTGDEFGVLELLAELADAAGLETDLHQHDLRALRTHADHPGEEAPRDALFGVTATLPGSKPGRLALNGHVDVVWEGTEPWRLGPWSGAIENGHLHGRGALDMKGPLIAALHALRAIKTAGADAPTVVLMGVPSEEDGGLGTFAELERDDAFDAALLPEPTGLTVVCAQAGALTFKGVVHGKAAHAAERLAGVSAIDRYVPIHQAMQAHERAVNADVAHALMKQLELPYPLLVGRVNAGEWSSMVPDRLEFEGRLGVPVGADLQAARDALEDVVGFPLEWSGGAFAPGETDSEHPWAKTVRGALSDELGRETPLAGVPWGADMRLFTARGIPTVMVGTTGIELAHAVDESVAIDELVLVARAIIRAVLRFQP